MPTSSLFRTHLILPSRILRLTEAQHFSPLLMLGILILITFYLLIFVRLTGDSLAYSAPFQSAPSSGPVGSVNPFLTSSLGSSGHVFQLWAFQLWAFQLWAFSQISPFLLFLFFPIQICTAK